MKYTTLLNYFYMVYGALGDAYDQLQVIYGKG